jgi:hypothetical protein
MIWYDCPPCPGRRYANNTVYALFIGLEAAYIKLACLHSYCRGVKTAHMQEELKD